MPNGISNWTKFHWPYEPLKNFTRSEPFPTEEMKATYIGEKPSKRGAKDYYKALLARKKKKEMR